LAHARAYQQRDDIPWPVAVDDLQGSLHQRLGPANVAYIMGSDGAVVARVLWAADLRSVRHALEATAAGQRRLERRPRLLPVLRGASEQQRIFRLAGPRASRDMRRVAPPVYLTGRIADLLPTWPPLVRGSVAAAASVAVHLAVVGALWRTVSRLRPAGDPTARR
jgi:hypothetical protein